MNQQQKVVATVAATVVIAVLESAMANRVEKRDSKTTAWTKRAKELLRLQESLIAHIVANGDSMTKDEIMKKVREDSEYINFVAAH